MPESSSDSGQRDSVTEDPLLSNGDRLPPQSATQTTGRPSFSNDAVAIQIGRRSRFDHSQPLREERQIADTHLLPLSSTSRAIDTSAQLPPSPPSTPSHSPPADTHATHPWPGHQLSSHTERELRQALAYMHSTDESVEQSFALQQSYQTHAHQAQPSGNVIPLDTPDATPLKISPVDGFGIRHQPAVSLRDFVSMVLPNIVLLGVQGKEHGRRGRYIVEDAGMEVACPGWSGAVLVDTKPTYIASTAYALSPSTPRLRFGSSTSVRMSRASSASSTAAGLEKPSPRRTLLTQMANWQVAIEDLRTRILDVLDHATERLHADNVIFILDRSTMDDEHFRAVVHGLCYVGASIIGFGAHESDETSSTSSVNKQSTSPAQGGDVDESIHAPRCVAPHLVLLSVDV